MLQQMFLRFSGINFGKRLSGCRYIYYEHHKGKREAERDISSAHEIHPSVLLVSTGLIEFAVMFRPGF